MIKLSKKKHNEIKTAVVEVLRAYGNIKLSVPIKKIVKFLGYRLVPYSTFMKDTGLTYKETIKYFDTEDACADYETNTKTNVIFFNDIDKSRLENNRVRWSIAHELGHIVLGHHFNKRTRLFRNSLSNKEYNQFEEEADMFASYILVPYIILSYQNIKNKHDISNICKISPTAARYRYNDFIIWLRRKRIEEYDKEIFRLYNASVVNQKSIFCLICGSITGYNGIGYCYMCGSNKLVYKKVGNNMIYNGIELDKNKRVLVCPICNNEQIGVNDGFCKICGTRLYNFCINYNSEGLDYCNLGKKLDGNARFCPYCGNKTYFLEKNILSPWKDTDYEELPNDDDLPF